MDAPNQFDDRHFPNYQQGYRFNDNSLALFSQPRHNESQALSPGQPRSRCSSYTGSPTSLSAHRSTVSQPDASGARLQPNYFPTGPTCTLPSTGTPISSISSSYGQPIADSTCPDIGYTWDGSFGISMSDGNCTGMSRSNSEK